MSISVDDALAPWRAHEAVNRLLLDNIPDGGFYALPLLKDGKPSRGRNVARMLAHMIEVRLSQLRKAELALLNGFSGFEKGAEPSREEIAAALAASSRGIEARLAGALEKGELIRGRHPLVYLGYLISHESHHRGQIVQALKQSGFAPNEALRFGIWEKWFKA